MFFESAINVAWLWVEAVTFWKRMSYSSSVKRFHFIKIKLEIRQHTMNSLLVQLIYQAHTEGRKEEFC